MSVMSRRFDHEPDMRRSGLQGSYNAYTTKRGIRIPNGAIIVFSLWFVYKDEILSNARTDF